MTKLVYASQDDAEQNFAMLDLIPDTHAWIKDMAGRFVYGNRLFFERFGFSSMQGLSRKCDLAPASLAGSCISDDTFVLEGGVVSDRLELITRDQSLGDWFLTSKWHTYNPQDDIIASFAYQSTPQPD